MKATHFHENATYSNSCICCMQPVHRFHLGIPAWDLLLIGCQAPGPLSGRPPQEMGARPQVLFFGRPPQEMGARPQGILLERLHQKWVKGPRASFLETKSNPETIQKNPRKSQNTSKGIFSGRNEKMALFWQPGCHF